MSYHPPQGPPPGAGGYPPPGQGVYPPPQASYAPPPQQGAVGYGHQQQKPAKSKGLFGNVMTDLRGLGKDLSREFDNARNDIHRYSSDGNGIFDNFSTGSVVQLISRASGRTLQIVQAPSGELIVDGCGGMGNQVYNAHWHVTRVTQYCVLLHNNNNYIAIVDGRTTLRYYAPGVLPGPETKLFIHHVTGQFITLQCESLRTHSVGVLPSGELKPAIATGSEIDGQFSVYSVYRAPNQVVKR